VGVRREMGVWGGVGFFIGVFWGVGYVV